MSSDALFRIRASPLLKNKAITKILTKKIVDFIVFFFIFVSTIGENFNLLIDLLLF